MPFLKQVNARQKKTSSSCYSKTMKQISLWSYFRAFYAVGAIPRYRGSPAATTSCSTKGLFAAQPQHVRGIAPTVLRVRARFICSRLHFFIPGDPDNQSQASFDQISSPHPPQGVHENLLISFQYAFHQSLLFFPMRGGCLGITPCSKSRKTTMELLLLHHTASWRLHTTLRGFS